MVASCEVKCPAGPWARHRQTDRAAASARAMCTLARFSSRAHTEGVRNTRSRAVALVSDNASGPLRRGGWCLSPPLDSGMATYQRRSPRNGREGPPSQLPVLPPRLHLRPRRTDHDGRAAGGLLPAPVFCMAATPPRVVEGRRRTTLPALRFERNVDTKQALHREGLCRQKRVVDSEAYGEREKKAKK